MRCVLNRAPCSAPWPSIPSPHSCGYNLAPVDGGARPLPLTIRRGYVLEDAAAQVRQRPAVASLQVHLARKQLCAPCRMMRTACLRSALPSDGLPSHAAGAHGQCRQVPAGHHIHQPAGPAGGRVGTDCAGGCWRVGANCTLVGRSAPLKASRRLSYQAEPGWPFVSWLRCTPQHKLCHTVAGRGRRHGRPEEVFCEHGAAPQITPPHDMLCVQEAGIDMGGLMKEFLESVVSAGFDPNRGLFAATPDGQAYPNPLAGGPPQAACALGCRACSVQGCCAWVCWQCSSHNLHDGGRCLAHGMHSRLPAATNQALQAAVL